MRLRLIILILFLFYQTLQADDSRFSHNILVSNDSLLMRLEVNPATLTATGDFIPDISGRGNHAFCYGMTQGDTSGATWLSGIRKWGFAEDGSAADSVIVWLKEPIDSTDNITVGFWYLPKSMAWQSTGVYIFTLRNDTSGTNVALNFGMAIQQRVDTLKISSLSPNGTATSLSSPGIFSLGKLLHIAAVRNGNLQIIYVNGDSIGSLSTANQTMRTNRIR